MTSWIDMLKEFHKASEIDDPTSPATPPEEKNELRIKLIEEEYNELMDELCSHFTNRKIEQVAKELVDLIYVTIGTGLAYGIDMDRAFNEVHRANMSKFVDGKPLRREDGKILKGPNYSPPDMGIIWND